MQSVVTVSERERVTTRSKIAGIISFVGEKFVQNMVRIVKNVRNIHNTLHYTVSERETQ